MELGDQATPRADVDGHSGNGRDPETAAYDGEAAGLHEAAVSSGDPEQQNSALDWRGNRAVTDVDAVAPQGASWRSQRYGVAEDPEADVRGEEYFCAGVAAGFQLID